MAEDFVATYGLDTRPFAKKLADTRTLAETAHREMQKGIRKAQEDFVKPFVNVRSLALTVGAGIAGAFYVATKGMQEYAKSNDYAAEKLTRLSRLKQKFFEDVGRNVSAILTDEDVSRLETAQRMMFNPTKDDRQTIEDYTPRVFRGIVKTWNKLFGEDIGLYDQRLKEMESQKFKFSTLSFIDSIKSGLVDNSGGSSLSEYASIPNRVKQETEKLKELARPLIYDLDRRGMAGEKATLEDAIGYYGAQRTKIMQDAILRPIAMQAFRDTAPAFLESGQNREGLQSVNFGPRMSLQQKMDIVRQTIEKKADQLKEEIRRFGNGILNLTNQPIVYQDPGR